MARRRQISTQISVDKVVNKLAVEYGDFAVMLYTWMIPHAEEDATLTGDPEEILFSVIPGRRDKTAQDVVDALSGMSELGLIEWDVDNNLIGFPPDTFYKYQSNVKEDRRRKCSIFDFGSGTGDRETPPNATKHHESAPNNTEQHETPENTASISSSVSSSTPNGVLALAPKPPPKPKPRNRASPRRSEAHDAMFELVLKLWLGLDWQTMTQADKDALMDDERGRINRVSGQLVRAGATLAEVEDRWNEALRRANGEYEVAPESLTKRWTKLSKPPDKPERIRTEDVYPRLA